MLFFFYYLFILNLFLFYTSPGELEVGSAPFVEQDVHRGTLRIRGVQEIDGGQYSCVASSSAGTAAASVSLEVGGRTTQPRNRSYLPRKCTQWKVHFTSWLSPTAGPLFSEAPVDVVANIGENVTLPCTARGSPQPSVAWRRQDGGHILSRAGGHGRIMQLDSGHLLIQGEVPVKHDRGVGLWCATQAITASRRP